LLGAPHLTFVAQEAVEPEGKLNKAERPPEPPKNPFLLDIGQSRIYSTRIAAFSMRVE
jgi:hypothetical protein